MVSGKKLCIYCQRKPAVQKEHVIARQFFPEPRPNDINLPTVPSCGDCNERFHLHEDYLRTFLCSNWEATLKNRAARDLLNGKVLRSLKKQQALRKLLLGNMRPFDVYRLDGSHMGQVHVMDLDMERAGIVCKKIVIGLLYDRLELILPSGYTVQLWSNITDKLVAQLTELMTNYKVIQRRFDDGVFTYAAAFGNENPAETIWLCSFYDTFYFAATTMRDKMLNAFQKKFGQQPDNS